MIQYYKKTIPVPWVILGALAFLSGCTFQTYSQKPLDPAETAARLQARDPSAPAFQQYLLANGYPQEQLPIQQWGLPELTLSAFFFHPQLEVARAQWRAMQAAEITAARRPNPGISGLVERHSEHDGISPWLFGLSLDIPLQNTDKRQADIDRAAHLSEASRIEIGQAAWQVRSRLSESWINYHQALQQVKILQDELELRQQINDMLQTRLDAGMLSSVELGSAALLLQRAQQQLLAAQGQIPELRVALANSAGLPPQAFRQLSLASDLDNPSNSENQPGETLLLEASEIDDLQETALLNRLDIRAALARYAAAEAKVRREIAGQYPDIVLSPGYSYDQGDRIWSLGFSTLLALLDKNEGPIAEALSLRDVEAAQFEALQASVIAELEQARAGYLAAVEEWKKARQFLDAQQSHTSQLEQQFEAGYSDRLELTTARLSASLARQSLISAEFKVRRAITRLENLAQRPLQNPIGVPGNINQSSPADELPGAANES